MLFRTAIAFVMVVMGALPLARAQAAATQAKPGAPQTKPSASQTKPAAQETKPAAPQTKPVAPETRAGAPAPKSSAAQTEPAAAQARPVAKSGKEAVPAASKAPQKAQGSNAAAATAVDTDQLVEPAGFAYSPEARRDPFVSLLRRGSTARSGAPTLRAPGLGGLSVDEITLRGTLRNRESFVAIAQGADQKTYIVRAGDKLLDGTIRAISQNDMVIVQQINDPLSLETQREVRKVLRQIEAK